MTDFRPIRIEGEGITLSKLVWRLYRRPAPEIIAQTLDANPGLSAGARDPFLPVGAIVNVVWNQEVAKGRSVRKVVRLFGVS